MRSLGATRRFAVMRAVPALLMITSALIVTGGVAAAEDGASEPTLFTLTTLPDGWQNRTDLRPELEVQPDGRAVKLPDVASRDRKPETAPRRLDGAIPKEVLNAAVTEVRTLAATDMGMPKAPDQSSMLIDYMSPSPAEDVHLIVYAPESTDGLTDDQKAARVRFTALYRKLLDAFAQDR